MKNPFALIILLLSLGGTAFAQVDEHRVTTILNRLKKINQPSPACVVDPKLEYACDALSVLSCKPGTFDDGTGSAKDYNEDAFQARLAPLKEKTKGYYADAIFQILQDQDPKYNRVRDFAVQSMQQAGTPDCGSSKKSDLKNCFRRVADLLAGHHAKIEFHSKILETQKKNDSTVLDFAILQNLNNLKIYTDVTQKAHEKTQKLLMDEKASRKIEKDIFPKVKKILVKKIDSMVTNPDIKTKLIDKIESIKYDGSQCLDGVTSEGLLLPNALYQADGNTFKFCNGLFFLLKSEFSIAQIIAHELSHSIDPCNIQSKPGIIGVFDFQKKETFEDLEAQYPFPGLLACLRSRESVGALSKANSLADVASPFCDNDQIGEAFSDWMGAEVLADYTEKYNESLSPQQKLIGYSNVFRSICNMPEGPYFDSHPSVHLRIDRILMANPKIRKQVGCGEPKNGLHYCQSGGNFKGTRAVYVPTPVSPAQVSSPLPNMQPIKIDEGSK